MAKKADLEKEVAELRAALAQARSFANSTAQVVSHTETPTMVPVKNNGGTAIFYEYEFRGQKKMLQLGTTGGAELGVLPIEVWQDLKVSNNRLIKDGMIIRTDEPSDNPNVIDDVAALIEGCTEKTFKSRIAKITNPNVIFRFVEYLELLKDKSGKVLAAQRVIRDRYEALTAGTAGAARVIDDTE